MPTLDEVKAQIGVIDGGSAFLHYKEIKALPSILWEDERVERLGTGIFNSTNGVIVATNKRLLFLNVGLFSGTQSVDFGYDKISSIQCETGLLLGKLTIYASGNKAEISSVEKNQARNLADSIRVYIGGCTAKATTPPNPSNNVVNALASRMDRDATDAMLLQIERLANLKSQGVLTEEEFNTQKQRLLAGNSVPRELNSEVPEVKKEISQGRKGDVPDPPKVGKSNINSCVGFIVIAFVIIVLLGALSPKDNTEPTKNTPVPAASSAPASPAARKKTQKEIKAEQLAKQQQLRREKAEAERKRKAEDQAAAEAARKEREEWESNGLILLRLTLKGAVGEYGNAKITGTIINRTGRTLNYAQITFNLYDKSGAQVGSAVANVNGLESNGRWKFEAIALTDDFATYKPSEMTGF